MTDRHVFLAVCWIFSLWLAYSHGIETRPKPCGLTYQVGWVSETKLRALADELESKA